MTTITLKKAPVKLLLRGELIKKVKLTKSQLTVYLNEGMPHYLIGNEYRFLEGEVKEWLRTYTPSQDRLEREFRDKRGRSLKEYVTEDIILSTLRIQKDRLTNLKKNGLPFQRVGEKHFYHVQDILEFSRKGEKQVVEPVLKNMLMPLVEKVPADVPIMIVDGSYNFNNATAGTGVVLVTNREAAAGYSTVRKFDTRKTIVCELLAILDALKLMKKKKFKKAIIITDQKVWTSSFSIDLKTYQGPVKQYINDLNQKWNHYKGKVEIRFVGELNDGKNNPLYKKAHDLSQEHKNSVVEGLKF
ncbi:hypothetical protein DYI25_04330 [Mesobacillus boroniphilus]|uniref:RNase H type-1 domain-containing protein n=1 Tax=Mesobacillus boroniphilus TaxID=308892 RepID=A0A944CID3_9BACI|nr:reverse transcriptase-like protein [Mesobacillus boroniphilus]MBS8263669.1 hypothetical protein [Mesobacillus boroniphilus]